MSTSPLHAAHMSGDQQDGSLLCKINPRRRSKRRCGFLWKVDLQVSSRARSSQDNILNNGILFFIPGFYPLIFVYTATGWELLLFIASIYPRSRETYYINVDSLPESRMDFTFIDQGKRIIRSRKLVVGG